MNNREIIQESIDYIESNLKTEIAAQELSDMAGFSLFHYYRLFQSATGMPVFQYITHRKLIHAIYEIRCGRKMVDVALEYGFDTYAGFYRAFKREFGCTPSAFLKHYNVKKPYQIHLLEEEHIMLSHKKIAEILKHWNLENESISDVYYKGSGNRNDNAYYVGDEFIIKFTANLGKLTNHIQLSKSLENVGLYAATPIKTTDNEDYIHDGELYFCLTNRLEGSEIVTRDMYEGDYKTKARFVGEIIGQLHEALKNADALVNDTNLYESVVNWAIPKTKELLGLSDELCKDYTDNFGKRFETLPTQIIHRDPNPGNIILNKDKWGFIDFELSERNLRIFDPCYAATAILSESFSEGNADKLEQWIEIYQNIIYGYDSVATLSQDERTAIPYVILSNQLVSVAWFAEQDKYKDIFETNIKMTKWIVEHFDQLRME
nr:helix-turn-helix domain-containing protein [Eubacterium sp.]